MHKTTRNLKERRDRSMRMQEGVFEVAEDNGHVSGGSKLPARASIRDRTVKAKERGKPLACLRKRTEQHAHRALEDHTVKGDGAGGVLTSLWCTSSGEDGAIAVFLASTRAGCKDADEHALRTESADSVRQSCG